MTREAAPTDTDWRALQERDRTFDGCFVYVAVTTSIYCRPSCPARLPRRGHVVILPTAADAERRGYLACRRCRPQSSFPAPFEASVQTALSVIMAQAGEAVTLSALSQATGLSPNHLQRVFARLVGISPRLLCNQQRLARLKRLLRAANSIVEAVYQAGYGSMRAVYEAAGRDLGMTPAAYQQGGAGMPIQYALSDVSSGRALVAATPIGVCAVRQGSSDHELTEDLEREFQGATLYRETPIPPFWAQALLLAQREDPLMRRQAPDVRGAVFEARARRLLRGRAGTCMGDVSSLTIRSG